MVGRGTISAMPPHPHPTPHTCAVTMISHSPHPPHHVPPFPSSHPPTTPTPPLTPLRLPPAHLRHHLEHHRLVHAHVQPPGHPVHQHGACEAAALRGGGGEEGAEGRVAGTGGDVHARACVCARVWCAFRAVDAVPEDVCAVHD